MVGSKDHAVSLLWNSLLALSASVLSFPGMWEIETDSCLSMHRMKISLVMSLQFLDLVPAMLRIYEIAVVLPQRTFI